MADSLNPEPLIGLPPDYWNEGYILVGTNGEWEGRVYNHEVACSGGRTWTSSDVRDATVFPTLGEAVDVASAIRRLYVVHIEIRRVP